MKTEWRWWRVAMCLMFGLAMASPAVAQQIAEVFAAKLFTFISVMLLCSFVFQVAFVHLGARFLRLEGGLLLAFLAVLLGGIFGVVVGFAAIFVAFVLPAAVKGIVISGATMAGGGLAIKILFKAPFAKALLLYLIALTLNTAALCVVLVVMY